MEKKTIDDIQSKATNFFSKGKMATSISGASAKDRSESNIYNFSEVSEKQEEDKEDVHIVQFIEKESSKSTKPAPKAPISKRPVSAQKKPHSFNKLNEKEKEHIFLNTYDENLKLKDNQKKLELQYNQMEVKFKQFEKQMRYAKAVGSEPEKDEQLNQLKEANRQKELENEQLKQKLAALSQAHKVVQIKQQRKIYQQPTAPVSEPRQQQSQVGEAQIKDLLKLNEMFKKRCLEQESQIRSLQAMMNSKVTMNKELSDKNVQFVTLKERYEKMEFHLQAQRNQIEDERKRQSEVLQLLRDEREKNHSLEQQVRSLELMSKSAQDLNADLTECKRQKSELEEKLKVLMESPFFRDFNERATVQARLRTIESELNQVKQDNKHLKDTNARLETENQIRRQELSETNLELKKKYEECKEYQLQLNERDKQLAPFKDLNYWDNDQFLKVLGNLKLTGEDPAWRKIEFIDRTYLDSDDPNVLRKEIEHLKLEKGELAAHLEKTQTLLKTRQDIEYEKERIHQTEIEKLTLKLNQALNKCTELAKIADLQTQVKMQKAVYEAEGIKYLKIKQNIQRYDDTVSVFSVEPQEEEQLQPGENFFDFWLGNAQLEAGGVQSAYQKCILYQNILKEEQSKGTLDPQAMLTFLTVDFYDHETQHTSVSEGVNCDFNLQVSFKVLTDAALIQYLESGFLKIELYMSKGSDAVRLGSGVLSLRDLVHKNLTDGISTVISGHITINGPNNQFIGIVQYKGRMRQPISQIIRWLKEQNELELDEIEQDDLVAVRKRKLVVVIDKASGFNTKSNTFVYYSIDNKDFNTITQPGAAPRWDYRMIHELIYNQELVAILKRNPLEFYIIDDNQPLTTDGQSDKVGIAYVELAPLLNDETINIAAEVRNDAGERTGCLYIKLFWYEAGKDDLPRAPTSGVIQQSWEDSVTNKIAAAARARGFNSQVAFRVFDFDNDQVISYEDFVNAIKNILGVKINSQEMQLYYQKLPQPLNQQNFDTVMKLLLGDGIQEDFQPSGELSRINQLVQFNSQKLPYAERAENFKRIITERLQSKLQKGKSRSELFNEIDQIRPDGYISIAELYGWLKFQGVQLKEEDVADFVRQYLDVDRDDRVNITEFFTFILGNQTGNERVQQNKNDDDPVTRTLMMILQYAVENNLSLIQIRQNMDYNKNNYIEREEMRKFLIKCGILIDQKELNIVMDYFDINKDKLISMQEFTDALSRLNKKSNIVQKTTTFGYVSDYITQYLLTYMKKRNKSMADLFNEIDMNGDGYLQKDEIKKIFKYNILVPLDSDEFQIFFDNFDQNKDGRISIKEFVSMIQPQITKQVGIKQQIQRIPSGSGVDKVYIQQLQSKVDQIVSKHSRTLLQSFELKEDPKFPGFINPNNFRSILQTHNTGLSNTEIDKIIDEICERNSAGLINYVVFVQKKVLQFEQTSTSGFGSLSQLDQERAINKAKEVFSRISRALQRAKMKADAVKIFNSFDTDHDNKITKQELSNAFTKMGIKINEDDKELIFTALDKNGDGFIVIDEFCKWIDV